MLRTDSIVIKKTENRSRVNVLVNNFQSELIYSNTNEICKAVKKNLKISIELISIK
jgi:hypothetical protein